MEVVEVSPRLLDVEELLNEAPSLRVRSQVLVRHDARHPRIVDVTSTERKHAKAQTGETPVRLVQPRRELVLKRRPMEQLDRAKRRVRDLAGGPTGAGPLGLTG